jgi:hypothetical protein
MPLTAAQTTSTVNRIATRDPASPAARRATIVRDPGATTKILPQASTRTPTALLA